MKSSIIQTSLIFIALFAFFTSAAQDTLTMVQLEPLSYTFQVKGGKMSGPGATFLREEMQKAQYTMIGEYHGSKRISEFTEAIIPFLDSTGYRALGLEVGPNTGKILNNLKGKIKQGIRSLHDKYMFHEEDNQHSAFPFFYYAEDAAFLQAVHDRDWEVFGIDQEFYFSGIMIADLLYDNLSAQAKAKHQSLYAQVRDSLHYYYQDDLADGKSFPTVIRTSPLVNQFLSVMNEETSNREMVADFSASMHIYWLYDQRQWFENNATRIKYMKKQLRRGLRQINFDLAKDKLLIKMGGYHLSKGFSPLGLYEVGNTLQELAAYHGNTCLNIAFSSRFYTQNGQLMDIMESKKKWQTRLRDLDQMGKQDAWVVIDLRPMIKGHFYRPVKYKFNEHVKDLIQRYDLIIIPATELDPTPNYTEQ